MTVVAVVLMVVVYGIVELVEHLAPNFFATPQAAKDQPRTVALVVVASFGSTFLVKYTVWAHEQVFGGHPLDRLNVASTVVAALLVAGLATGLDRGLKALSSVGTNRVQKPIAK